MSTLRVNTLQNTSTTDGGISIDNSGHVTIDGQVLPSAGPLSNRNLIINGAMQVAQRGTSASISDGADEGYRTLDRWITQFSGGAGGVATMSQATEVPNNTFKYSLKVDVTTADTDVATNHAITFQQRLEGQDIENSGWDYTNSDSYLTLSFWARSTKAGTYCCWFYNTGPSANYTIVKEYTLAANTWKHVTLSFPGNSNLNFAVGSNAGLRIGWTLVAGTDRQITADTWQNVSTKYGTSNQVNFFDSTDNVWNLTGVQLEVGSVATPFEHRSWGDELARCQRYYYRLDAANKNIHATFYGSSTYLCQIWFPVYMRAVPTVTLAGGNASDGILSEQGSYGFMWYKTSPSSYVQDIRADAEL